MSILPPRNGRETRRATHDQFVKAGLFGFRVGNLSPFFFSSHIGREDMSSSKAPAPQFVVAIINDNVTLYCALSLGAACIVSEVAQLPRHDYVEGTAIPPGFLRVILYSPNLIVEDYPNFAWDAEVDVDGMALHIGSVKRRCEVHERRFSLAASPRNVQLKLRRHRQSTVRSPESENLAMHVLSIMQDPHFNPRGGSVPLQALTEETRRRYLTDFCTVVGNEHLGSFRSFLAAHPSRFSIFHYHESEIASRRIANVTAFDERVAIRKEVRDSLPPLLPLGSPNEEAVVQLLKDALKDRDSHAHVLMRELSKHEVFRVSMSAGFSALMHWLQRHTEYFVWSTDPQMVCTIGLAKREEGRESTHQPPPADSADDAAESGDDAE